MKTFSEFAFISESTPTEVVQNFIYATMRRICDIQEDLQNAIDDYMEGNEPDGIMFGLRVAESEKGLKWLADMLEDIHNNSVRHCAIQSKEGGKE